MEAQQNETRKIENLGKDVSSHVRLSEPEHQRIRKEQQITGKSIPWLLKNAYFKGPLCVPLMGVEEQRALLVELRRIGNNINQIAKKINSGFREGWNEEFNQLCQQVSIVRQYIAGIYGGR